MAAPVPFRCLVPADAAGLILGRGGGGLRQIFRETGAEVSLLAEDEVPETLADKVLVIRGTAAQKEQALRRVVGQLRQAQCVEPDEEAVFVAAVPGPAVAAVVGAGGAQIREVAESSGAEVIVSRQCIFGMDDWPVSITGPAESVVRAAARISAIVQAAAEGAAGGPALAMDNLGRPLRILRRDAGRGPGADAPYAGRPAAQWLGCEPQATGPAARAREAPAPAQPSARAARARSVPAPPLRRPAAADAVAGAPAGPGAEPLGGFPTASKPTLNEQALLEAVGAMASSSHQLALLLPQALLAALSAQGFLAAAAARSGARIEARGELLALAGPPLASALATLYLQEKMLQMGLGL